MIPVIEMKRVALKRGRNRVFEDLDFTLQEGEVTVLLGRNGAGKSTLLRLAMGLLRPKRGSVRVLGEDPTRRASRVRRRIGFVPDHPDVDPRMKPRDLIRYVAPFYPDFDPVEATRLHQDFAVSLDQRFDQLSRGQATKSLLAVALASFPELLLLDEVFAGLDPVSCDEVLEGLLSEGRLGERTLLISTHDLEVTSRIADRVVLLENGQVSERSIDQVEGDTGQAASSSPSALRELFGEATEEARREDDRVHSGGPAR